MLQFVVSGVLLLSCIYRAGYDLESCIALLAKPTLGVKDTAQRIKLVNLLAPCI